jgi:ketosteroid isomerase-like protein
MTGEQFAEILRKGFDAFAKGDMDTLRNEVFTADTKWHVGGKSPLGGDYSGQQVFEWFGRLFELSGGTFKVEVHDITTSDQHAVALTSASAERGGKRLSDAKGTQVHHYEGGKISETWLSSQDQDEFDKFWS